VLGVVIYLLIGNYLFMVAAISLYFSMARWNRKFKEDLFYAVSKTRVYAFNHLKYYRAEYLEDLPAVTQETWSDQKPQKSIFFGEKPDDVWTLKRLILTGGILQRILLGGAFKSRFEPKMPPFIDLDDADKVYALITRRRAERIKALAVEEDEDD
jgi:hypothetical protein